jgi:hypothetical protein
MVNPLKWKHFYRIGLTISVPLGAMAGVACGYIFSGWTWGGMLVWVARRADDVTGWAALGAVLAGIVAFGALALSWPRRRPGTAGAAPQARSRTQPPGADNTGSTSSRRRQARAGGVSLQEALQGAGSAS